MYVYTFCGLSLHGPIFLWSYWAENYIHVFRGLLGWTISPIHLLGQVHVCICLDTPCMLLIITPAGPAEDTDTCLCSATIQNLNPRSTREPAEPYDGRLKVDLIYPPHLLLSDSIKASDCFRFMKTVIKTRNAHGTMDDGSCLVVANGAGATYATLWIFQAMATTTLILRIISRSFLTRDIGWEDVIMAFGWVRPSYSLFDIVVPNVEQAVNLASTIIITISSNTMIHAIDTTTTPSHLETTTVYALKLSIIAGAINPSTIWLPKISVALLLSRLLQPKPWTKVMLIVPSVVGFVAGGIGSALITFLQCNPVAGQWDPERYHPTCWDPSVMVDYNIPWAGVFAAQPYQKAPLTLI